MACSFSDGSLPTTAQPSKTTHMTTISYCLKPLARVMRHRSDSHQQRARFAHKPVLCLPAKGSTMHQADIENSRQARATNEQCCQKCAHSAAHPGSTTDTAGACRPTRHGPFASSHVQASGSLESLGSSETPTPTPTPNHCPPARPPAHSRLRAKATLLSTSMIL